MKLLVDVPTFDGKMWADTAESIDANIIRAVSAGHDVDRKSMKGYGCGPARTRMAEQAIKGGYDYIMMVDDDVVLPPDALENLLEHEVDVCLGFYAHQGCFDGKTCLCKPGRRNYDLQYYASELREMRESGIYTLEVKGGGMGCALIRTSVFDRIAYPYFKWVDYDDRHGTLSEDLYFCEECAKAGITIYADTRVACGHHFRHVQDVR